MFEQEQNQLLKEQLRDFEKQLEDEEISERDKVERSMAALQEERNKMLAERKQHIQQRVSQMSDSTEGHQQILQSHNEDTQKLVNKIDAERLRMQADLQERIRKRRVNNFQAKEAEMLKKMQIKMKEREEEERLKRKRLDEEEKQKLDAVQKTVHDELEASTSVSEVLHETVPEIEFPSHPAPTLNLPLTEQDLTSLVLSTPLYQKLEEIKLMLTNQKLLHPAGLSSLSQEAYIDPKDASWVNDNTLHAVEIDAIPARAFVVYKFGCCVLSSLVARCGHSPVSLLIADKIPPNNHFHHNTFRNSFAYDARNRILYVRIQRLDNVGEFVLVLVHTLSHITAGTFENDWDHVFVKEFYRSLSVCCNDLFLSKYRTDSRLATEYCTSSRQDSAKGFLESVFHTSKSLTEKHSLVDDLVDTRVMMNTDLHGNKFTHERMMARLEKFTDFQIGSKLRAFLDEHEGDRQMHDYEEIRVEKSSSTELVPSAKGELDATSTEATRSLNPTKSRWQSIIGKVAKKRRSSSLQGDQYKKFLGIQIRNLQERISYIEKEYSQVTDEKTAIAIEVANLEKHLSNEQEKLGEFNKDSSEFESQKGEIKKITTRLSSARTKQATYDLRVNGCLKRLEGFKRQLKQKVESLDNNGQS